MRNESDSGWIFAQSAGLNPSGERSECEHFCWDPKDGELCLNRVKPGETLVEARRDSDVKQTTTIHYIKSKCQST